MGCTEFFVALYFDVLRHTPSPFNMDGQGEDLFFLSNGHISPVFYSVLARSGYFSVDELNTFRKLDSRLQGHPTTHEGLPGVRIASGSLGQGLSVAVGAAQAKKLAGDDRLVFTLHGDGELQKAKFGKPRSTLGPKRSTTSLAPSTQTVSRLTAPPTKSCRWETLAASLPHLAGMSCTSVKAMTSTPSVKDCAKPSQRPAKASPSVS